VPFLDWIGLSGIRSAGRLKRVNFVFNRLERGEGMKGACDLEQELARFKLIMQGADVGIGVGVLRFREEGTKIVK
jgi:hypothetical protein